MWPALTLTPDIVISNFQFLVMLGILITAFYLYYLAPRYGLSQLVALDVGIVGGIFGIAGAKLFHVVFEYEYWDYYRQNPWSALQIWRGGLVSYGAYFGGITSILLYLKIKKLPLITYADFISQAVPILVVFIRMGCIAAGCCYGKPTDFFIHLTFPHLVTDKGVNLSGVPLHASQLYDLMNGVFMFGLFRYLYPRRAFQGQIFILLLVCYAFVRFFIEFLRGDADRGLYFGGLLSTGQIISTILVTLGSLTYIYLWKKAKSHAHT